MTTVLSPLHGCSAFMWIDPESFHPHHPRASTDRAKGRRTPRESLGWAFKSPIPRDCSIKTSSRRSLLQVVSVLSEVPRDEDIDHREKIRAAALSIGRFEGS